MGFLSFIGTIFKPLTELVDELHTSDEEKGKLRNELFLMQSQLVVQAIEYEKAQLKAKSDSIVAEAKGQSWLQRSWRPLTMITFVVLVVGDSLGYLPNRLAPEAWTLLQVGLGGYVTGRSLEKIAPHIRDMVKGQRDE